MNLLAAYRRLGATRRPAVLATLADDCVVTESYGPVYHRRTRVEEWMRAWFEKGGSVQSWAINRDLHSRSAGGRVDLQVHLAERPGVRGCHHRHLEWAADQGTSQVRDNCASLRLGRRLDRVNPNTRGRRAFLVRSARL